MNVNKFTIILLNIKQNIRNVYLLLCKKIIMQTEKIFKNTPLDITDELKRSGIKWVRLNFCDPFGFLHQISVNSNEITEDAFKQGFPRLDGSSIKGFKEIYESDMLLKPDPSTFAILPEYFDKNHHNRQKLCLSFHGCAYVC